MTVSLRSQSSPTSADAVTSLSIAMPAGIQVGDYLIVFIHQQQGSTTDLSCSGWKRICREFIASDQTSRVTGMFGKVATGSEASSYTFGGVSSSGRMIGFAAAFSGVNTTDPIATASAWTKLNATSSSLAITPNVAAANRYSLEIWAANFSSPNSYTLANYDGGLTLLGDGNRPTGAEDTGLARSILRVWSGVAPAGGLPAHTIDTAGPSSQSCSYNISLRAADEVAQTIPTVVGHTSFVGVGTPSPFVINPATNPSGLSYGAGDWVLVILTSSSNLAGSRVPTAPAGWTQIVPFNTVGTGTMTFGMWGHKIGVGETSFTWTQSTTEVNTLNCRCIFIRNAQDIANWTIGTLGTRAASGGTTLTTIPSVTLSVGSSLALLTAVERTSAVETDSQVTITNFTKQWFENGVSESILVATKNMPTAGSTSSATVTYPNTHAQNGAGLTLGIPWQVPVTPPGLPIKVSNGSTLVDAEFKLADGVGGLTVPGAYKAIRPGYASVSQMLAQSVFYCAHRGGSRDFPEMSLYSYGQSVLADYPALEISLARTSDGVWFGLHDSTLDRTSGVTGVDPATLTWTQVQAYQILGSMGTNNPTQPNRPYMRWEELINMYYSSHVIFVDPKVAISYRTELLNMMDALPNSTNRFVAKYYGVSGNSANTSGWNFDAKARGYKTWGYFYEADAANFATYAPRWDILGMDYGASQTAWDNLAAVAPGKPIMGHICPTQVAVNTALSKGAAGVMVSGVKDAHPPVIS